MFSIRTIRARCFKCQILAIFVLIIYKLGAGKEGKIQIDLKFLSGTLGLKGREPEVKRYPRGDSDKTQHEMDLSDFWFLVATNNSSKSNHLSLSHPPFERTFSFSILSELNKTNTKLELLANKSCVFGAWSFYIVSLK